MQESLIVAFVTPNILDPPENQILLLYTLELIFAEFNRLPALSIFKNSEENFYFIH